MHLVLHEYSQSGNCYKIRLTAALLGVPIERREYDIQKGETRTPEFLTEVNPNGRIPVLQVGDRFIPAGVSSSAPASASPTSPSTPTRMWRRRVASGFAAIRRSSAGWSEWPPS